MRFVQQYKLTSTSPATVAVGAISLMQQSTQVPSCNSSQVLCLFPHCDQMGVVLSTFRGLKDYGRLLIG